MPYCCINDMAFFFEALPSLNFLRMIRQYPDLKNAQTSSIPIWLSLFKLKGSHKQRKQHYNRCCSKRRTREIYNGIIACKEIENISHYWRPDDSRKTHNTGKCTLELPLHIVRYKICHKAAKLHQRIFRILNLTVFFSTF